MELPTLTPASFLHQRTCQLPEEEPWRIDERELKKRPKYLIECKNKLWRRWKKEYLVALRERHNMAHKQAKFQPKRGDVVIVQSENKNRGVWPLANVEETYPGRDGVRAVRVKTPNGTLERAAQQLYPLELKGDVAEEKTVRLNPDGPRFEPQPTRDRAAAARWRIREVAQIE